jgi:metallo-beta-lactamase family protein
LDIRLTFCGAAGNVTGSRYLVEANGSRIYVDCGMFQEWKYKKRNWESFVVPPGETDAVVLTHGHLDHCGLLPRLVRKGFAGPIYCTAATADIAKIVMQDAGRIQEEDARYKSKRHRKEGRVGKGPKEPLYTSEDAEAACERLQARPYDTAVPVADGITATFFSAGHILGAASVSLRIDDGQEQRTIVFSGDVGPWDMPILEDPVPPVHADYVLVESTYGDKDHPHNEPVEDQLERVVNETFAAGGNLVIPSFAVERAQDLLYHLSGLLHDGRIPRLKVFLDSPMAIRVTDVFKRNSDLFDGEAMALINRGEHPCDFPGLVFCRSRSESKAIADEKDPVIIIAGSGMCTAGRIKHHLAHDIGRPATTVLFVGYQASGTLGRRILSGEPEVRIFGEQHQVRARVTAIHGFSAHAGRSDLKRWLSSFAEPPRRVFVTHGEPDAAEPLAELIREDLGYRARRPDYLESVNLD